MRTHHPQIQTALTLASLFAAFAVLMPAQTPQPAQPTVPHYSHSHKRTVAKPVAPPQPVSPTPVPAPVPETPNWPAFAAAAPASVRWDSHGLSIDAANSSLQQILRDVSTMTGIKVEGLNADQRVFGIFGPGKARDVLSQLLQGSGYNVLMIGDQAPGTPRQILLSQRQSGAAQVQQPRIPQPGNDEDPEVGEQPQPDVEPVPQPRPNFPPGLPPRTPQQIMQEMQQRQLQQQQQPQPNTPQD